MMRSKVNSFMKFFIVKGNMVTRIRREVKSISISLVGKNTICIFKRNYPTLYKETLVFVVNLRD